MSWVPILDGDLADRARDAIDAIAAAVAEHETPESRGPTRAIDLAEGKTGVALFLGELARVRNDAGIADRATAVFESVVDRLAGTDVSPGLFDGFAGIGWVQNRLYDDAGATTQIDEGLSALLDRDGWDGLTDLISGLVGYGVYLIERPRDSTVDRALARLAAHLEASAHHDGDETWWATPSWSSDYVDTVAYPPGALDLGMSHGVAGIASFLALAADRLASTRLLVGALTWLWNRRVDGARDMFPAWIIPGGPPQLGGHGWCRGDIGIAMAFLHASRVLGDSIWRERGLEILRRAARREPVRKQPGDISMCHGASSYAHLMNRAFQLTGDEELRDAARAEFRRLLDLRRPGEPIAGFATIGEHTDGLTHTWPYPGLLFGATGVGLALLGACTSQTPAWDRALLIDLA